MDKVHYEEMVKAIDGLTAHCLLQDRKIYVFGHCNATEELVDLLMEKNFTIKAILDNNTAKHGSSYRGIPITLPETILSEDAAHTIVCIVARAYAAMNAQLRNLGFAGDVVKLVDYNSYAEYSLSEDTMLRIKLRDTSVLQTWQERRSHWLERQELARCYHRCSPLWSGRGRL